MWKLGIRGVISPKCPNPIFSVCQRLFAIRINPFSPLRKAIWYFQFPWSSFVLPFNIQSSIFNIQLPWSSIILSSIQHPVWSYARSARMLYIKITKGYILQHGMVLFLIVRSDQEINKTLSVFAVQHFPSAASYLLIYGHPAVNIIKKNSTFNRFIQHPASSIQYPASSMKLCTLSTKVPDSI